LRCQNSSCGPSCAFVEQPNARLREHASATACTCGVGWLHPARVATSAITTTFLKRSPPQRSFRWQWKFRADPYVSGKNIKRGLSAPQSLRKRPVGLILKTRTLPYSGTSAVAPSLRDVCCCSSDVSDCSPRDLGRASVEKTRTHAGHQSSMNQPRTLSGGAIAG
jgi:hypothetical protein